MVTTRTHTAVELLAMGSGAPFELIEGELIPVSPSSAKSNVVLSKVHGWLFAFVNSHKSGTLSVGEGGYLIETNPDTVLAPDVGFVLAERMAGPPERGYFTVRPDLVVEVISPTDERGEINRKQATYERAGVPLVWWIDPGRKTATVHMLGQPTRHIGVDGVLNGGDILPGFELALADIFD